MRFLRSSSRATTGASVFLSLLLAGAALTGCSPLFEKPEGASEKPGRASEPAEDTFEGEDLELLGKVTAGEAPEDLLWIFPAQLPDGWTVKRIADEAVSQVTVSERCIISFHQPQGYSDPKTPDSAGVAEDFTEELGREAFDTQVTVVQEKPAMLNAIINEGAMEARFSFAKAGFTSEKVPELGGTTYAYRAGEFALIAVAVCGGGEFPAQGEKMRTFIETAGADVTY